MKYSVNNPMTVSRVTFTLVVFNPKPCVFLTLSFLHSSSFIHQTYSFTPLVSSPPSLLSYTSPHILRVVRKLGETSWASSWVRKFSLPLSFSLFLPSYLYTLFFGSSISHENVSLAARIYFCYHSSMCTRKLST